MMANIELHLALVAECPNCRQIIAVNSDLSARKIIRDDATKWLSENYKVYWINQKYLKVGECKCNIKQMVDRLIGEVF